LGFCCRRFFRHDGSPLEQKKPRVSGAFFFSYPLSLGYQVWI
jgi:hypothetical protein